MRLPMNTSLATLKPSGIRRINALAAQHPGCIALALGEPDFPTPDVISAEVTASLNRGDTHYPPNNGRPALREALSAYMGDAGLTFSADEVILTDGATEALSATFMAMLNPGDEVIIPTPAFGLYESIVVANHAKAVFLDTEPAQFQIDEEALRACVTPATKAIVICSPNNPTGCILSAASLDAVARVAEQARLAHNLPERRYARVIILCPLCASRLCVGVHASELVDIKHLAVFAHTTLGINNRALRFGFNLDCDDRHRNCKQN